MLSDNTDSQTAISTALGSNKYTEANDASWVTAWCSSRRSVSPR